MAKISTYPQPTIPQLGDYLLGTDISDLLMTKNFLVSDLATLIGPVVRPYKVYSALISQTGTANPTVIVLENTLGGTIVWSRPTVGVYTGTLTGAFTVNKTTILNSTTSNSITLSSSNINQVVIETRTVTLGNSDGLLTNATIEIKVYN